MRLVHEIIRDAQAGIEITDEELRDAGRGLAGAEWHSDEEEQRLGLLPGYFEVQMGLVRRWRALPPIVVQRPALAPVRMTTCGRCGCEFPARQAMSSSRGTVCPDCY